MIGWILGLGALGTVAAGAWGYIMKLKYEGSQTRLAAMQADLDNTVKTLGDLKTRSHEDAQRFAATEIAYKRQMDYLITELGKVKDISIIIAELNDILVTGGIP